MDAHDTGWQRAGTDHVAAARALVPLLQAAGPRIDAASELPSDVVDAMHAAGMFRLLLHLCAMRGSHRQWRRQRRLVHEPGLRLLDVGSLSGA